MYNFDRLLNLGIQYDHAVELRRISMTLNRWFMLECGDSNDYASSIIVRGSKMKDGFEYSDDGKPFLCVLPHKANKATYTAIADREKGALKRLAAIMKN
jgi:hypothetical protein